MYVLISLPYELDEKEEIENKHMKEICKKANVSIKNSRLVAEYTLNTMKVGFELVLGNKMITSSQLLEKNILNDALCPATNYNISVVLKNEFMNKTTYNIYHMRSHTVGTPSISNARCFYVSSNPEEYSHYLLWVSVVAVLLVFLIGLTFIM